MERGEYIEAEAELNELGFAPKIIAEALKDFTTKEQAIMRAVELVEKEDEVPLNQMVLQPQKKKKEQKDPLKVKNRVPKEKKKPSEKIPVEGQGPMQSTNEGEVNPKEPIEGGEDTKVVSEGEKGDKKEKASADSDYDEDEWTSESESSEGEFSEYHKLVD